jgi:hypothetical protein
MASRLPASCRFLGCCGYGRSCTGGLGVCISPLRCSSCTTRRRKLQPSQSVAGRSKRELSPAPGPVHGEITAPGGHTNSDACRNLPRRLPQVLDLSPGTRSCLRVICTVREMDVEEVTLRPYVRMRAPSREHGLGFSYPADFTTYSISEGGTPVSGSSCSHPRSPMTYYLRFKE